MEELQKLRVDIDGLFQLSDGLSKGILKKDNIILEEVNDCSKSLLMAKAWSGKLMGYLGGTTPYKNDGQRTTVADIEKTDAISTVKDAFGNSGIEDYEYSNLNHIQKVDKLRQWVEDKVQEMIKFIVPQGSSREANIARTQVFVYLSEARLHLGFELERLKGGRS